MLRFFLFLENLIAATASPLMRFPNLLFSPLSPSPTPNQPLFGRRNLRETNCDLKTVRQRTWFRAKIAFCTSESISGNLTLILEKEKKKEQKTRKLKLTLDESVKAFQDNFKYSIMLLLRYKRLFKCFIKGLKKYTFVKFQ